MKWRKLGRVFAPSGEQAWAQTHAYIPTCLQLDEERIRVYCAFLDSARVGRLGFVDVSAADPRQVLQVSATPCLDIGEPGTFDDNGVSPVCVVQHGGQVRLYYVGWQLGVRVRYYLLTGLAVSDDGGNTFRRGARVPILERSDRELFVRSAPHVLLDDSRWRMWYIAGSEWVRVNDRDVPTYDIRYLESEDGVRWGSAGRVCIEPHQPDEYGFGRPFVQKEQGAYRMWYSIRSRSRGYRLGCAESRDGLVWQRQDETVGIDVSADGWDSEMIGMGCVHRTRHATYLFYNGNNYGETGFGVATLEQH
jgi:predicted GH43/DUF377 family glycosyl hydrolase